MNQTKRGLNSFQLKIIALVIMTIDHFGAYKILTTDSVINGFMRMTGRIAAPLFLFLIVEGLRHTRSKKKYILRLYIASVAVQIIIVLTSAVMGNIFQTFFYAALYITCIDKIVKREKNIVALVILMLSPFAFIFIRYSIFNIFIPSPFGTEYSFLFVLLAIAWYFINNKIINCMIFAGLSLISWFAGYKIVYYISFYNFFGFTTFHHLFIPIQWLMILAVPFMLLYNGEKGRSGLKYFFYIYYPAHQYLFFIIAAFYNKK